LLQTNNIVLTFLQVHKLILKTEQAMNPKRVNGAGLETAADKTSVGQKMFCGCFFVD
jgi:hypothetical protein